MLHYNLLIFSKSYKRIFLQKTEELTLNDALLCPEFFTQNLDYSQYLQRAFKDQIQIETEYQSYIPKNEDLSSLLMIRDFQKILTGAKPIIFFYHSPVDLLLKSIKQKSIDCSSTLLETVLEYKSVRIAAILLKAFYWLQIYFEAIHEYQEHGDDFQFQVFGISRSIQNLSPQFDYEEYIEKYIFNFQKKADWIMKFALFYSKCLETFQIIASDNTKPLRQAIGLISNQDIQQLSNYQNTINWDEQLKIYKDYFGDKFAITFLSVSDGQLSVYYDEIQLFDLASIIQESKRLLSCLVDNISQVLNDSLFSLISISMFGLQFQNKLFESDNSEFNLWEQCLQTHFSKHKTPKIIISNDIHQFQILSVYFTCIGKTIAPLQGKDQIFLQQFAEFFSIKILTLQLQVISSHSGRLDRIFRDFMKTKVEVKQFFTTTRFSSQLSIYLLDFVDFFYIEFGGIPYLQSLLFSQITDKNQISYLYKLLSELSQQSFIKLVSLVCKEINYIQFIQNNNFKLFIRFIEQRTAYYFKRIHSDAFIDETTFYSLFKSVALVSNLQINSVPLQIQLQYFKDEEIAQLLQTPTSPGLFLSFQKQARLKLKQLCLFYQK